MKAIAEQITLRIEIINVNELPEITGDNAVSIDENSTDIDARRDEDGNVDTTGAEQLQRQPTLRLPAQTLDLVPVWYGRRSLWLQRGWRRLRPSEAEAGPDLRFKEAPDFEDPKDANKDNTYEVTLNVSDGTGGATTLEVKVTVKNIVIDDNDTPDNSQDDTQEEAGIDHPLPHSAPSGRPVRRHPQGR